MQQIATNKPPVIIVGDSIAYGFNRYQHVWNNYVVKEVLNWRFRGGKEENKLHRIKQDKPSD